VRNNPGEYQKKVGAIEKKKRVGFEGKKEGNQVDNIKEKKSEGEKLLLEKSKKKGKREKAGHTS